MKAVRIALQLVVLAVLASASAGMLIVAYYGSGIVAIRMGYPDGSLAAALLGLGAVAAGLVWLWRLILAALWPRDMRGRIG